MSEKTNPWPDQLLEDLPDLPINVMASYAKKLGPKTKNLLLAEARSSEGNSLFSPWLSMDLHVPGLSDYTYTLFTLNYTSDSPEAQYPLRVEHATEDP